MALSTEANSSSNRLVICALVIGCIFVASLVLLLLTSNDIRERDIGGSDGKLGGQFTLQGAKGDVSLSDFNDEVVMLYFGFVSCSQVCPVSLKVMKDTVEEMTAAERNTLRVLLVSVDVENDSVQAVDDYVKEFHQDFIGLTGTSDQIISVVDEYGAYVSETELKQTDASRAYRHSSRYYIINKQGELVDAMRHSTTPNELRARLRQVMAAETTR